MTSPKHPRRPQPAEDGTAPRLKMSVEVLRERYEAGEPLHDLALELGVPRNTLRGQLEAAAKAHPSPSPTGSSGRPEHGGQAAAEPPHPARHPTTPGEDE